MYTQLKNNTENQEKLHKYLYKVEHHFTPSLSKYMDLGEWSSKLLNEGTVIAAIENGEIVGASAVYCNPDKYDYSVWALWSALNDYRQSVGMELYRQTTEYCKKKGSMGLDGLCDISNKYVLKLHQINGFRIIEQITRPNNQIAAKIRLNFVQ